MLKQFKSKTTQSESENTKLIKRVRMQRIYTRNNTYQDTQNLNHKTYRIKKLKFPEIRTKNHTQTHTQTRLTTRYEKPYQNRTEKQKNALYGTVSKIIKAMPFQEIDDYGDKNFTHHMRQFKRCCLVGRISNSNTMFLTNIGTAYLIKSTLKLQTHNLRNLLILQILVQTNRKQSNITINSRQASVN